MLRKLVSTIAIVAFTIVTVGQVSPAQAWPDYTVGTSNVASNIEGAYVVPVGKTVNSNAVFVYAEGPNDDSPRFLKSYTVSPSGVISDPVTIATNSLQANYVVGPNSVWIDPAGRLNVIFWSWGLGLTGLESKVYSSNSIDGISWTPPELLDSFVGSSEACQITWCGIREARVALSAAGTVALTYIVSEATVHKLYLRTKPLGKSWSAKSVLNESNLIQIEVILKSIGKGWLATWANWGGDTSSTYSAYSSGDKLSSWTAPQLRDNGDCPRPSALLQISPTKIGLIYVADCGNNNSTVTYKLQAFDTVTKRFGATTPLDTIPQNGDSYTYTTQYLAGQSAFGYSIYSGMNGDTGYAKYILFRNGQASVHFVNQAAAVAFGRQEVTGLSMDPLGHLTVVWSSFANDRIALTMSQIYRGTRADIDLPISNIRTGDYPVIFSPDNDVYISSILGSRINAIERIRSDAPQISGTLAVTGKPKVKTTLKAKLPGIQASQLFQKWSVSYQWMSCQYQVPDASGSEPVSCVNLGNANAAAYAVKASDKGKYLVVKTSVKSDNTSQVLYSASTLVVK